MQESERIKKLARHYGSQANFAKRLGVGQSNVTNWIRRGALPSGMIKLISQKCPEISISWLTTGKGEMLVAHPGEANAGDVTRGIVMKIIEDSKVKTPRRRYSALPFTGYTTPPGTRTRTVGFREIARVQPDAYRAAVRVARKGGFLVNRGASDFTVDTTPVMPVMPKVVAIPTTAKRELSSVGKRRVNEILNEALGKCYSVIRNGDGTIALESYNIGEKSKVAVIPVEKEAERYIKVDGFPMSPTIENGDVIGVASTDWFEQFSKKHIYTIKLTSGELLTRRIIPPTEGSNMIRLVSDNPYELDLELSRTDIKEIKRVIYIGKSL